MGEYCVGTGRARSAAAILAVTLLGLVFGVARANAITVVAVGCSEPGGGVVNVTIASNDTSGITLAASGGDYSISSASSGTSVNSDCAGLSTATYPSVVLAQTGGLAQTIVLNDESGGLAGGSTCTQIVSALDTSNNSLQIENDEDHTIRQYDKVLFDPREAIPVELEHDNRLFVVHIDRVLAIFRKAQPSGSSTEPQAGSQQEE